MEINEYGHAILSAQDIVLGFYQRKLSNLNNVNVSDIDIIEEYNAAVRANADDFVPLTPYQKPSCSPEEYDQRCQSQWLIPENYKTFDISSWLTQQCSTPEETSRVKQELDLYCQYGLLDLLKVVKYLVDTMREHKIVWGVGRGSSVSSYCLYLIGLTKVNSMKFGLDIHDFIKNQEEK